MADGGDFIFHGGGTGEVIVIFMECQLSSLARLRPLTRASMVLGKRLVVFDKNNQVWHPDTPEYRDNTTHTFGTYTLPQ